MKKLMSLLIVLVMCFSLVATVSATENEFVPSITAKDVPDIIVVKDEDGIEHVGRILDAEGNVLAYIDPGCLSVTPIAYVMDDEIPVPADVERLLRFVYEELNFGDMKIPYEKHEVPLDPERMVIRDLFDARWVCGHAHEEQLAEDGVTLELTFDLGIDADIQMFVTTYDEEADEWEPIVKCVNNGDGTVTCIFEHLCAIEFSMEVAAADVSQEETPEPKEEKSCLWLWILLFVLIVIAIILIIWYHNKKKNAKKAKSAV